MVEKEAAEIGVVQAESQVVRYFHKTNIKSSKQS